MNSYRGMTGLYGMTLADCHSDPAFVRL